MNSRVPVRVRARRSSGAGVTLRTLSMLPALLLLASVSARGTPPNYESFDRSQRLNPVVADSELMRIWVVYVAQGDGILIQFPSRMNSSADPDSIEGMGSERIDLLIDGGSTPTSEADRIGRFIARLYGAAAPVIEHAAITHHDQDHVVGLTRLLAGSNVTIERVYHNGLASYKPGHRGFPANGLPQQPAIMVSSGGQVVRGMAFVDGSDQLRASDIIADLADLRDSRQNGDLQGIYADLADAVSLRAQDGSLKTFDRAYVGAPFVCQWEAKRGSDTSGIRIEMLWPGNRLFTYGGSDWGETINGNSLAFRLTYRDFSMLFTGDLNDESEDKLLDALAARGQLDLLSCDVLKVPHHGSSHAAERFFTDSLLRPVVSVVSLGDQGFRSKTTHGTGAWQHPSPQVIQWLGGAHRVYSTFTHEKRFRWEEIRTEANRQAMIEKTHILIETDGHWFRVVEVPVEDSGGTAVPSVYGVRRGNGTRWIAAK